MSKHWSRGSGPFLRIRTRADRGGDSPRRNCGGKDPLTFQVADRIARTFRRRNGGGAAEAYRCPVCRGWHVGHGD
jgi:hypothetical protein